MRLVLVLGAQQRIDAALERQGLAARYAGGCASARPACPCSCLRLGPAQQ